MGGSAGGRPLAGGKKAGCIQMNLAEYSSCDGVALADLVRRREVSPKELAHLFVEAVEKVNPKINSVIEVYSDRIEGLDDHAILRVYSPGCRS